MTACTDRDKRLTDTVAEALHGNVDAKHLIDIVAGKGTVFTEPLCRLAEIAVAYMRMTSDLKHRRCSRVTVPTEEGGTLTLEAEQLMAAQFSTLYDERTGTLNVYVSFHDDGQIGRPCIAIKDGYYTVTIRRKHKKAAVLDKANNLRDKLGNSKRSWGHRHE